MSARDIASAGGVLWLFGVFTTAVSRSGCHPSLDKEASGRVFLPAWYKEGWHAFFA